MSTRTPPRSVRAILRWILPAGVKGESFLGDLAQEYRGLCAERPDRSHHPCYIREALKLAFHYSLIQPLRLGGGNSGERTGSIRPWYWKRPVEEIRLSLRRVARSPGLAAFAILATGLGIGATTTLFTFTNLIFQKLPFEESHRILSLSWDERSTDRRGLALSPMEFTVWRREQTTLQDFSAFRRLVTNLSDGEGSPERLSGARISVGTFRAWRSSLPWEGISSPKTKSPGLRIERGRPLTPSDDSRGEPVVIVKETLARRHFPDRNPLGQHIRLGGVEPENPWLTIVGVVPDMERSRNEEYLSSTAYLPMGQWGQHRLRIMVTGKGDPGSLVASVRSVVAAIDPNLPVHQVSTLGWEISSREATE